MMLRYIPYVQTNFVLGPRRRQGAEPFELTKRFLDLTPGAFPGLLAAVRVRPGGAAQSRIPARRAGVALPVPLPEQQPRDERHGRRTTPGPSSTTASMDLSRYSFSVPGHRAAPIPATGEMIPQWMNVVRAVSSEGWGRIRYHTKIRGRCWTPTSRCARYFEGENDGVAGVLRRDRVRRELGPALGAPPGGRALRTTRTRTSSPRPRVRSSWRCPLVPLIDPRAVALGAAPKFEVLLTHQPLTLGRPPGGEMPQQELASKI